MNEDALKHPEKYTWWPQPHEHCQRCGNAMGENETAFMVRQRVAIANYGTEDDPFPLTDWLPVPICQTCLTPKEQAQDRVESICAGCSRLLSIPDGVTCTKRWIYCSDRCRRRMARKTHRQKLRLCKTCGNSFQSPRKDARYCSSACRQWSYRRRRSVPFRAKATHEPENRGAKPRGSA
jgi:hypothetical protein